MTKCSFWEEVFFESRGSDPQRSIFYMMEVSAVMLESVLSMLLPESQSCDSEAIWRKSPGAKLWSHCVREKYTLETHCYQCCSSKVRSSPRFFLHSVHPCCSSLKGIVHQKENCVVVYSSSCSSKPTDFLSSVDEKFWRMHWKNNVSNESASTLNVQ